MFETLEIWGHLGFPLSFKLQKSTTSDRFVISVYIRGEFIDEVVWRGAKYVEAKKLETERKFVQMVNLILKTE